MRDRTGDALAADEVTADEGYLALKRLLDDRWSCRAFESREVSRPAIERLLSLAQRSASWCNTQPWSVIVTTGSGTDNFRAALAAYAREHSGNVAPDFAPLPEYHGVYRERRRESGWQLYEATGVRRGDREASARQAFSNYLLFGAPHVAIITTDASHGSYGAVDGGLYIATFLLAARSLGIATVPQAALALHAPFIRGYFSLPEQRRILAGISFGYPDLGHPANSYRTSRAPLDDVVTWVGS